MLAVFTDDRTDPIDTLPDMKTLQRFWIGKDPLFMSPVNERMLEQCRRVAYVNLRYGEPEKGIAGWSTDRGQAYIRYGDPLVLQARPPEFDTHIDDPIVLQRYRFRDARWFGTSSDQYRFGKELWEYENFVLVFDNTDTRDSWKFRIASLDGAIVGLNDLVERVPHRFVDPFKDRRFEVTYQIGQFRGAEGKTRIEIYYAVPAAKVDAETAKGLGTVDLEKGLFLFSADWDTLVIQKHQVDKLAWVRDRSYSKGYLLSGEVLNLEPGSYHVAGEVVDRKSDAVGGFRTALRVRAFSQDSLEISSILLARRIVEKPERPFGRDQYVILPNPVGATARNKKAYFYFEVYNLARNEFGRTHYQVTYQTKSLPTGGADSEPDWVTAVTQEVTGDHTWEPVYLALELQGAQPGLRNFRVIIEDKLSSQEASASTQYRIRW
jgi:GWxTD domain-containing protein